MGSWDLGDPSTWELVSRCCSISMAAHHSAAPHFLLEWLPSSRSPSPAYAIFAFPGSWSADDWLSQQASDPFGGSQIDGALFPSLRTILDGVPAVVNAGFLGCFRRTLENSAFRDEVDKALNGKWQIIFTGHSSGGSISALAAAWLLEYLRVQSSSHSYPLCVTFGSPLVGNNVFNYSLLREGWSCYFLHFVMNFDIVPRIFLAPLQSIKMDFQAILHILYSKSFCFGLNFVENSQLVTFFTTVLRNSQSIATHCACLFMRCTNPLLATFTGLTQLSPYRPFGEYVFCTSDRSPVVVKNSEAVLQLLLYALQPGHEQEVVEAAHGSVKEHLVYESAMQKNFKMPDVVYLDHLDAVPPSLSDAGSEEIQLVGTLFEDLRLSAEARLCLHAAGEQEKQRQRNLVTVDTTYSKIVDALRFLSEYQERCMNRGLGYYDTFKVQNHSDDFNANVKRMELAGLWDQIVEMVRRYELPCSFESQEKWVNLGTCYRRLVEPLDIANYYRHAKNEDTGPYLLKGRPSRYKYTQAWLEYTHQMPRGSSSESCFWAKVEELCIGSNKGKPYLEMEGRITELEEEAKHWRSRGLLKEDVFLEDSTFVKWWKTLPGAHRLKSHIRICSQPLSNGQGLS